MTVYILVVCCKDDIGEYEMLQRYIRLTWGSVNHPNVKVFYLWCSNFKKKGKDIFILDKPEGYGMLLWKTLAFLFKHRHDDFDYVFRVNVGCYVHIDRLYNHLLTCPREIFYSGPVDWYDDIRFISGTGFILSKDLVKLSLQNIKKFGFDHIDDVSYGRFMQRFGVNPTPDYSRRIFNGSDYGCEKTYQFKLRSKDGNRFQDCLAMEELHNRFYS